MGGVRKDQRNIAVRGLIDWCFMPTLAIFYRGLKFV